MIRSFFKANKFPLFLVGLGIVCLYTASYFAFNEDIEKWFRVPTGILTYFGGGLLIVTPFFERLWDTNSLKGGKEDE